MSTNGYSPARLRHELFATLWPMAILFQLASVMWIVVNALASPPTWIGLCEIALLCSCVALLLRPASRSWLLVVAALQLIDFWLSLPHNPNHRYITACVDIGVLLSYSSRRSLEECFRDLASGIRFGLLVVYFFVTFHKLNSAFVNPSSSCTTAFYEHILATLPFAPSSAAMRSAFPYITLVIEAGIPLLLLFSRARATGVFVLLVFHGFLTFDVEKHFFDFTSTMYALGTVYLSDAVIARSAAGRTALAPRLRLVFLGWYLLAMLAAFSALDIPAGYPTFFIGRQLLWWVTGVFLTAAFLRAHRGLWRDGAIVGAFSSARMSAVVPILLLVNGSAPYFGVKTRTSLDMYSNLRAEPGFENHFIIRRTLDLVGHMSDLADILATSEESLNEDYRKTGHAIVFFELRRIAQKHPEMSVTYRRHDVVHEVMHAKDDPALMEPMSLLEQKLLWYRPVDRQRPSRCQW